MDFCPVAYIPTKTFGTYAPPARSRKKPACLVADMLNPERECCHAERKRQLQTRRGGFARPKARRAQDDSRLQLRNAGSMFGRSSHGRFSVCCRAGGRTPSPERPIFPFIIYHSEFIFSFRPRSSCWNVAERGWAAYTHHHLGFQKGDPC